MLGKELAPYRVQAGSPGSATHELGMQGGVGASWNRGLQSTRAATEFAEGKTTCLCDVVAMTAACRLHEALGSLLKGLQKELQNH